MKTYTVICAECGMNNPADNKTCGLCDKPLNGMLVAKSDGMSPAEKALFLGQAYAELVMAVERKFPGESRHQTALRYIREAESLASQPSEAKTHPNCIPSDLRERERSE